VPAGAASAKAGFGLFVDANSLAGLATELCKTRVRLNDPKEFCRASLQAFRRGAVSGTSQIIEELISVRVFDGSISQPRRKRGGLRD
jgi:hypothetical protein